MVSLLKLLVKTVLMAKKLLPLLIMLMRLIKRKRKI
jgi:hypothetical protein